MTEIQIGPAVLSSARFAAIVGFAAFLALAHAGTARRARLGDWAWTATIVALVAARIGYVIANLPVFLEDPLTIAYLWQGGFAPSWGLVAAAAYTVRARVGTGALPVAAAGLLAWGAVHLVTAPAPGATVSLPDRPVLTLAGDPVPLDAADGRPTVVNLWAPWCPPCRREMPMMVRAAEARPGIAFVFVDQGSPEADVRGFLADRGLAGDDVRLDPQRRVAADLGVVGLPTTLFFAADGTLAYRHVGEISRAELTRRADGLAGDRTRNGADATAAGAPQGRISPHRPRPPR